MQPSTFRFATDTATLLVCDPLRLKHRFEDDSDWWCWPPQEQVRELNAGNAAFVDLGADGVYDVQLVFAPVADPDIELHLACPSGRLFIGAGEEATCQGGEPQCHRGGSFAIVQPGAVFLSIKRSSNTEVRIGVVAESGAYVNSAHEPLVLK